MNQVEQVDRGETPDTRKDEARKHDVHYYTPQGEVVQLACFEPESEYRQG